jgi:hypothetical protein
VIRGFSPWAPEWRAYPQNVESDSKLPFFLGGSVLYNVGRRQRLGPWPAMAHQILFGPVEIQFLVFTLRGQEWQ